MVREGGCRGHRDFGRCFHWEIEFPEVFFDGVTRRTRAGFDVIIGNPPYDVVSELERGTTCRVQSIHRGRTGIRPLAARQNNLYKLLICQSLELLPPDGYFGFITPMAVLGDDQAAVCGRRSSGLAFHRN